MPGVYCYIDRVTAASQAESSDLVSLVKQNISKLKVGLVTPHSHPTNTPITVEELGPVHFPSRSGVDHED
jgi:hypothetical protein